MPRDVKTVLGWDPVPPVSRVQRAPVSHPSLAESVPERRTIHPRHAQQPQRFPEHSRPRQQPPMYREVPSEEPASRQPLALFDPYSQEVFAYSKAGGAATIPDLPMVEDDEPGGASWPVRLLQLALLSSVALMIWYMIVILQTAE